MELKHFPEAWPQNNERLLIVPYGIETRFLWVAGPLAYILLIVPYGIETS